jgi:hypothetical protein
MIFAETNTARQCFFEPSSKKPPFSGGIERVNWTSMQSTGASFAAGDAPASDLARDIALLSEKNRLNADEHVERELLRLRYERFRALSDGAADGAPPSAIAAAVPIDPSAGLPVVHALPDAEVVRSTILEHGSLVVRGLVNDEEVARLQHAVEMSVAARDRAMSEDAAPEGPWYSEFGPLKQLGARTFTKTCGVLAVDSPRGTFQLIDIFRRTGIDKLAAEFLGGPPILSAEKSVFRRVQPSLFASWHQDGAFLGESIRTLDVWISLSHCGKIAPSLEILPRRVSRVLPTGAFFDWDLDDKEIAKEFPGYTTVLAEFAPGDAILFDQLCVHRSGHAPGMTEARLAVECWLFSAASVPDIYTGLVL